MKDVSVIICAHNEENSLAKSVESILSQKGVALELILVNDGSADNTLDLMNELAGRDSRINIVNNPRNLGVSASRNRGLRAATGQWVCSVDADDWISEGRLARLVEAGRRYGVSIVSDDMSFIPEGFEHRAKRLLPPKYQDVCTLSNIEDFIEKSLPRLGGMSWGYMHPLVRLDFIKENNIEFNEDLACYEDWEFLMRCLLQDKRLLIVGEPLYNYLVAPKSLSKKGSDKHRMEILIGINDTIMDLARLRKESVACGMLENRRYLLGRMVSYYEIAEAVKSLRFFKTLKIIMKDPLAFPYHVIVGMRSLLRRVRGLWGLQAMEL